MEASAALLILMGVPGKLWRLTFMTALVLIVGSGPNPILTTAFDPRRRLRHRDRACAKDRRLSSSWGNGFWP